MAEPLTARLFDDADFSPIDPFAVFEQWFELALQSEPNDPNAMALATVDEDGLPDVRMVLLNQRDDLGYCFFTNFESPKGAQLTANPHAALCFHWKSLRRQVRIRGPVEGVSEDEADLYFASRAKGSRIASSVSDQSRPLESRAFLAAQVARLTAEIGEGEVRRPPHWSGFRLIPRQMEFWKDGEFRLHDRVRFSRELPDAAWTRQRLFP